MILFLITTYIIYIFLIIMSFIKIHLRLQSILNYNNLDSMLYKKYSIFSIIEGLSSFLMLLGLTLVPIIHFAGYFLVFAFNTEYTKDKILNIIINNELLDFKKLITEIITNPICKSYINPSKYNLLNHKIKVIYNYFKYDNSLYNLFIFYQFLSFKNSLHEKNKILNQYNKDTILSVSNNLIIYIEKNVNILFNIIKKYKLISA